MSSQEDELKVEQVIDALDGSSRKWIAEFADSIHQSYDDVMKAADLYVRTGEYTNVGSNQAYENRWNDFPEFWEYYEKVTGKIATDKDSFFSCAC